jgi:hypothetical protein
MTMTKNSGKEVVDWMTAVDLVASSNLPGSEFVAQGIEDLWSGRESTDAMLVAIASPRLIDLDLPLPNQLPLDPNLRLYELLSETHGEDAAYGMYNSLLRRLTRFARSAECVGWK